MKETNGNKQANKIEKFVAPVHRINSVKKYLTT